MLTPEIDKTPTQMNVGSEWNKAWRIIVEALKEMGVSNVDNNARAIIARLAQQNMLIVDAENVKD